MPNFSPRFSKSRRRKLNSEINVVPYIDVMLVLLIIFMVTTPLLTQGVKVNLPKAPAKILSVEKIPPIIVSINQQGAYFLNIANNSKQSEYIEDIKIQVQQALLKNPSRKTYVQADQAVDYGKVISVMVALQSAGVQGVGLITDPNSQSVSRNHSG